MRRPGRCPSSRLRGCTDCCCAWKVERWGQPDVNAGLGAVSAHSTPPGARPSSYRRSSRFDEPQLMRPFTPHPYQDLIIEFGLRTPRCAIWAGMGMGKSSSTLAIIDALLLAGLISKTLVLAPLRVARSTWPKEAKKWAEFAHLRVEFIGEWTAPEAAFLRAWSKAERLEKVEKKDTPELKALRTEAARLLPTARWTLLNRIANVDVLTVNYDILPQMVAIIGDAWPFDLVVSDEATRLKNFRLKQGGIRTQALSAVAHMHTKRWINLTGTPAPNGLQDLWGQTWFLDQGKRLGRTYDDFESRWFGFQRAKDVVNAHKTFVKRIAFPHAQQEIQDKLKDICLTLDPKDWFDLDDPIVNTLYVDLPPKARKHYSDMEKLMFTELEGHEIEAFGAAEKSIKCLQMASGAAYVGEFNDQWVETHDEKLQALESIVEEAAGATVLVAYFFRSDLARLLKHFPQGRVLDADPRTEDDWNAGRIPILFANPASAGHGLNLQDGGSILVYFGHWWDLEQRQQIIERIGPMRQKQAGHNRAVFVYNLVARGTVDEVVMARIETKREVQDLLMDYMKQKREVEHVGA